MGLCPLERYRPVYSCDRLRFSIYNLFLIISYYIIYHMLCNYIKLLYSRGAHKIYNIIIYGFVLSNVDHRTFCLNRQSHSNQDVKNQFFSPSLLQYIEFKYKTYCNTSTYPISPPSNCIKLSQHQWFRTYYLLSTIYSLPEVTKYCGTTKREEVSLLVSA